VRDLLGHLTEYDGGRDGGDFVHPAGTGEVEDRATHFRRAADRLLDRVQAGDATQVDMGVPPRRRNARQQDARERHDEHEVVCLSRVEDVGSGRRLGHLRPDFLHALPRAKLHEIGLAVFDRKGLGGDELHIVVALGGGLGPPWEVPRFHVARVGRKLRDFLERGGGALRHPDLDNPVSTVGGRSLPDKTQASAGIVRGIQGPKACRRRGSRQCRCSQE